MTGWIGSSVPAGPRPAHQRLGGPFGDPFGRDPEAVAADVRNDKVTIEHARQAYGVVIDPVTLKVDADATRAMRAKASR